MIRLLLILLPIIAAGTVIGALIALDPGYVFISYGRYSLETSFWVALLLTILIVLLAYLMSRLGRYIFAIPAVSRSWQANRKNRLLLNNSSQGLEKLILGESEKALGLLTKNTEDAVIPLLNYLGAAYAAHDLGRPEMREQWLEQGIKAKVIKEPVLGLTRAWFLIEDGLWLDARAVLLNLRKSQPGNHSLRKLLFQVCEALDDEDTMALLQSGDLPTDIWQRRLALPRLRQLGADQNSPAAKKRRRIDKTWKALPTELRRDTELRCAYLDALAQADATDRVHKLLAKWLSKDWSPALVARFGQIPSPNIDAQLQTARQWLAKHATDTSLLLAIGRIEMRRRNWEEARNHLRAAHQRQASRESCLELGRLELQMGNADEGAAYLLRALHQDEIPAV